jgi:hypothetical protein
MRRPHLAVLAVLAPALLLCAPAAAAPVKKCPTTKLTRIVNGVKTCVGKATFRPSANPDTRLEALTALAFRNLLPVRSRNGRTVRPIVTPALTRLMLARVSGAQQQLTPLVIGASTNTTTARLHARTAGEPVTSIITNPDGSVTGTLRQTSQTADGSTVDVTLGIGAKRGAKDGDLDMSVDLGGTVTQRSGASKTAGIRLVLQPGSSIPSCPTVDGKVPLRSRASATIRSGETFGSKRVRLGTVREATSVSFATTADGQMDGSARLRPIPYSVTVNVDYAATGQVLAFFSRRVRAVAKVTMTGTIDPVSGQISGTVTSNASATGFSEGTPAANAAAFRAVVEKMARDQAGRILEQMREVEADARAGKCTTLTFSPSSPGSLRPNAATSVQAQFATKEGNQPVSSATWKAAAAKGTVSPAAPPKGSSANLTVTGAATGPESARVQVTATSSAGISEGTWVGRSGVLPPSYSGTVSGTNNLTTFTESWSGTFTWTKTSETANPDGSILGLYALTAASVFPYTWTDGCTGGTTGPSGTIVAGDVEVQVSPAGAWTSALLLDVLVAPFTATCPPAPPQTITAGKAFFNSRNGISLRPMAPNGPIAGSESIGGIIPGTRTWNVLPGA